MSVPSRLPGEFVLISFQFFPEKLDLGIMAKILIKSMMNLPESDFLLCSYLIPATLVS